MVHEDLVSLKNFSFVIRELGIVNDSLSKKNSLFSFSDLDFFYSEILVFLC